jgi:hypothetical protein
VGRRGNVDGMEWMSEKEKFESSASEVDDV